MVPRWPCDQDELSLVCGGWEGERPLAAVGAQSLSPAPGGHLHGWYVCLRSGMPLRWLASVGWLRVILQPEWAVCGQETQRNSHPRHRLLFCWPFSLLPLPQPLSHSLRLQAAPWSSAQSAAHTPVPSTHAWHSPEPSSLTYRQQLF